MMHLAVVDDDEVFLAGVTLALSKAGYHVMPCDSGRDLLRLLATTRPDLILLDRMLPDLDGFDLCRRIKTADPLQPLILFSTRGEAEDLVAGLQLGADDYLPKPFPMALLTAKVAALLRRVAVHAQPAPARFDDAGLVLDPGEYALLLDGAPCPLTRTEFDLLALLIRHRGRLVGYGEILTEVMSRTHEGADHQVVFFHMASLRKKLGGFRGRVETVRARGYRYVPADPRHQAG